MTDPEGPELIHGSAVAFETETGWVGVLIVGASGSGKSELALELIALGAQLVADDQTEMHRNGSGIRVRAPERLRGWIELRGLGLLQVVPRDDVDLVLVVDMNEQETERLPYRHSFTRLGVTVACLKRIESRVFAIGLKHYIMARHWVRGEVDGISQS